MELIVILSAIVFIVPVSFYILKSFNFLKTAPGTYYDFTLIFKDTKPWTVILYIVLIGVLSLAVLAYSALPLIKLPA